KLSSKQKTDVLGSKKSEEKKLAVNIKEANAKRALLLDEKKALEAVIEKQTELERFIAPLKEVQTKAAQYTERVLALKSALDESRLIELEKNVQQAKQEMDETEDALQRAKSEVTEFRKQSDFEAVGKLSDEIQALSRQLNAALGARKELELQTKMVLVDEQQSIQKETKRLEVEQKDSEGALDAEREESREIDRELEKLDLELAKSQEQNRALVEKKEKLSRKQLELKERIERDYAGIRDFERKMSELEIENGKFGVRKADVEEEALSFVEYPTFESFDVKQLKERLPLIERDISKLGAINQKALDNFGGYEQEMLSIKQKADRLEEERLAVMDLVQKIEDRRSDVFLNCFERINSNFKDMHRVLGEGEGNLELENAQKPLEGGLLLEASLRGKEIHNIDAMSGGEKTLTALAFLFAIQLYDDAPFYIFDEADAALDKENSGKLARIIARISEKNQFIGITHNDTIVKQAHQIIGVALNEQKSSVVGLRLREAQAEAAA
ncbi:MAG: hypothetical protein Q7R47_03110, partial [Candidatus Diapherotrites archaeon]|nr:hypothetical protein [Candidatus Diapherotrites archaeon]